MTSTQAQIQKLQNAENFIQQIIQNNDGSDEAMRQVRSVMNGHRGTIPQNSSVRLTADKRRAYEGLLAEIQKQIKVTIDRDKIFKAVKSVADFKQSQDQFLDQFAKTFQYKFKDDVARNELLSLAERVMNEVPAMNRTMREMRATLREIRNRSTTTKLKL